MRELGILVVVILILLLLVVLGAVESNKRKKEQKRILLESFGKLPKITGKETIPQTRKSFHDWKKAEGDFCIDEITFHDLEGASVYALINRTFTSAGEDVLYHRLLTPLMASDSVKQQKEKLIYLEEHPDIREQLEECLFGYGKQDFDYTRELFGELKDNPVSILKEGLLILFYVISILVLIFKTGLGILLLAATVSYAVISYFQTKAKTLTYTRLLLQSLKLYKTADKINQLGIKSNGTLTDEFTTIQETSKKLEQIGKNTGVLSFLDSGSGNIISGFMTYLNLLFHGDLILCYFTLGKVIAEKELLIVLYENIGLLDFYIAVVSYKAGSLETCYPEFSGEESYFVEDAYHPFVENPVRNSYLMKENMIITGSNASGKSTFLKTVGVNALLAQTICICHGSKANLPFVRLYTSMNLQDSLMTKDSFYMAEIKALKRIVEAASKDAGSVPVLGIVDEVLRGTNTLERISAGSAILKYLSERNAIIFAATHDLEIVSMIRDCYMEKHFTEEVSEDGISFSYQMKEGISKTRNAIKLLEYQNFPEELVSQAEKNALSYQQ